MFLHPKIAFKLRESLYELAENSPFQIICATHSPLMIDISKQHASLIRIAKRSDESTITFQVGENVFGRTEDIKQWVQMVNRFNPHICEAFYADKVLLVEGDTEAIVYRDLLARFYPEEELFVLNTGSKANIPFFQLILTSFEIEHYVIHDVDSRKTEKGTNNPAWTLNSSIWELVNKANEKRSGLARRYVHEKNFEDAHGITLSGNKDKPLSAYNFAITITQESDAPCLRWLNDILGEKTILHDNDYVEAFDK